MSDSNKGSTMTLTVYLDLLPALQRLDGLLERAVVAAQGAHGPQAAADPYCGLYISQDEVFRLLARQPGAPVLNQERDTDDPTLVTAREGQSKKQRANQQRDRPAPPLCRVVWRRLEESMAPGICTGGDPHVACGDRCRADPHRACGHDGGAGAQPPHNHHAGRARLSGRATLAD